MSSLLPTLLPETGYKGADYAHDSEKRGYKDSHQCKTNRRPTSLESASPTSKIRNAYSDSADQYRKQAKTEGGITPRASKRRLLFVIIVR